MDRRTGSLTHAVVRDLPAQLTAGDLLVVNDTQVFPARLIGRRVQGGGAVECLLVARLTPEDNAAGPTNGQCWEALVRPGNKLKTGARLVFDGQTSLEGEMLVDRPSGRRVVRLTTSDGSSLDAAVDRIGHVPLPPYIRRSDSRSDRERYQTVFAARRGSIAAPTAGLHFDEPLLAAFTARGIEVVRVTLHVGYGTFQPVRVDRVEDHRLDPERYEVEASSAAAINRALDDGRRVIAVGTTTTRTLEAVARDHGGRVSAGVGETDLFIYPGFRFRVVQGLVTNFHLPGSSLLMLVAAFAGSDAVMRAYRVAVAARYRFYSYGDAMLVL
jgi:S-adenosylmethionine:tRNA ribosyltransferase-isomerase